MRRLAIPVAAIAILGLLVPQATGARPGVEKLSHTHPPGKDYSFFCGKLRGKAKKKYVVEADGPAVAEPTKKTVRMNKRGRAKVKFKIGAPGTHALALYKRGKFVSELVYEVPPPPPGGAAQGPFAC